MTDRALSNTLRSTVVTGVVLALVGFAGLLVVDGPAGLFRGGGPVGFSMVLVLMIVVWLAAPSQPRNALLWVLAVFTLTMSITAGADAIVANSAPALQRPLDISVIPADLSPVVAWTTGWSYMLSAAGFFGLLTFGLLLFPDGRLPSRRWRLAAILLAIGVALLSISQLLSWLPHLTVAPIDNPLFNLTIPVILLGPPASLTGLVMRYRRSDPETRARIKWIMWGAAIMVPAALLGIALDAELITLVGLLALGAGYGIAVVRHRLLDIDVVISKTLVYAALAGFIGLVYVAIVVGVGAWVGTGSEPNPVLAVGATALVAVAFQPVRRRLELVANRVVFGRRATPYEVLSEFSRRVAATGGSLLDDAARWLAKGTAATRVVVSLRVDGTSREVAAWPPTANGTPAEPVRLPIADADVTLGTLDLYLPPGQTPNDEDRRLAEQVASGMGLAVRNQLLTERLETRVAALRESRRRLVAVQDETRRRLERDLHDGAQQQLVALKVKLGLGKALADQAGASKTAAILGDLSHDADAAINAMREFARGVYPPLLEAEGLAAAITAQARRLSLPITIDVEGIGRYGKDAESTVYFCILEALRNAAQHANAGAVTVGLRQSNGVLAFDVTDDGAGFDPDEVRRSGLVTMTDRLDVAGGGLEIRSAPGHGTTLTGSVPVAVEVPA